jgi:hypothetical protein
VLRSRVPPLRLQAGAARGRHHNGLLVTSDLREMTATRPVTTPNLHCAPPCAKPADHHDTPHQRRAFFNAAQKKNSAAPPNCTSRTRIHRHNASDVRCEGGVAACALGVAGSWQPSAAGARRRAGGRILFRRSRAGTAPFCVAITTALFAESRFFHACFFRVMLWVRGRPAACAV